MPLFRRSRTVTLALTFTSFWRLTYFTKSKGVFKDHLVSWINDYLELTHGKTKLKAAHIMANIDHR
jgi:hypothetical protein